MASNCAICGCSMEGMYNAHPCRKEQREKATVCGLTLDDTVCENCAEKKLREAQNAKDAIKAEKNKEIDNLDKEILSQIFLTPASPSANIQDLGFVSGHCTLGTGLLTEMASTVTDMLGKQSKSYASKIDVAESLAISMIRKKCILAGGDAVYNVKISIAEATEGHGQLIVYIYGSACNTGKNIQKIEEWRKKYLES